MAGKRTLGTRAVVTGAGSGIGRAFSLELARRGGTVVCADIDLAKAAATAEEIDAGGGTALAVECDVSDADLVAELATTATDWFGGAPTLVVNNAGIGAGGQVVGETPLADWRATVGVNLWGVVHGCHVFAPMLREQGDGGIINVASAAAFAAAPRMAAYNASKAAVLAVSETLAAELAGTGVAVTVLCPTFVKTDIVANGRIDQRSSELATTLMRWTGFSPARVARTTLDAHDHGRLYVVPQLDAKAVWELKRHLPRTYTSGAGLIGRLLPTSSTH